MFSLMLSVLWELQTNCAAVPLACEMFSGGCPFLLTSVLRPAGACRVERFCTPAATKWYTSAIVGKHPQAPGEREVSRAPACKLWGVQWPLKSANTIYTNSNA